MNCGRPQDHRWHDGGDRWGALANGCSYAITQPETLWSAVLAPALVEAGRAAGVDDLQTYGEILRWARA
jgi:hypothetical protein